MTNIVHANTDILVYKLICVVTNIVHANTDMVYKLCRTNIVHANTDMLVFYLCRDQYCTREHRHTGV